MKHIYFIWFHIVVKREPVDFEVVVMPEGPHSTTNSPLGSMEHKLSSRKSSNLSTCSDDSLRKISSDSGISVASAHLAGLAGAGILPTSGMDDLIGEPRLSTATMQNLLAQQAVSSQLAAMNPTMLGMQQAATAAYAGLWTNPLAAVMFQQQQEAARKLLESANHGEYPTIGLYINGCHLGSTIVCFNSLFRGESTGLSFRG